MEYLCLLVGIVVGVLLVKAVDGRGCVYGEFDFYEINNPDGSTTGAVTFAVPEQFVKTKRGSAGFRKIILRKRKRSQK